MKINFETEGMIVKTTLCTRILQNSLVGTLYPNLSIKILWGIKAEWNVVKSPHKLLFRVDGTNSTIYRVWMFRLLKWLLPRVR